MTILHDLVWGAVLVPCFFARVLLTLLFGPLGLFNDLLKQVENTKVRIGSHQRSGTYLGLGQKVRMR